MRTAADLALLAIGAVLYGLAFPPYNWSSAGWVALTPWYVVLRGRSCRRAAVYGLLYGVMISAAVAYWLETAIVAYFVANRLPAIGLTLAAYLGCVGIYTALAAAGVSLVLRSARGALRLSAAPACWVAGEFARAKLPLGFAWELLGYSQYTHPALLQVSDLTGVYGLSFLLAATGLVVAEALDLCRARQSFMAAAAPVAMRAAVVGALAGVIVLYGRARIQQYDTAHHRTLRVLLIEHDMPAQERWRQEFYFAALRDYTALTRAAVQTTPADLIIWPEFASGFYVDRNPMVQLELARLARASHAALLVGGPRAEAVDGRMLYHNSAFLFANSGHLLGTYDKELLLPFAEYRPGRLPSLLARATDYPTEFSAGTRATVFDLGMVRFGVMICYEATYPEYARALVRGGANLLVNISNDEWLAAAGGRAAAAQHFAMGTVRAAENKRALARATMAGVTGFVDPLGRPYGLLRGGADGAAFGVVALPDELTFYLRHGDWFAWLCVALAALGCVIARGRIAPR
ncbi:MAG TPA: apolipoprotein N-acyltransferase [Candidatus Binataceae bacterium]|nr:apolipoprotein N-acyltransferase [Candidatus Binataceae bacterium]